MKGFVPTPEPIVDLMVEKLFHGRPPSRTSRILDPGCGVGAFVDGVIRWCLARQLPTPSIIGIESDPAHAACLRRRFERVKNVEIQERDFLLTSGDAFDYVIGNPPYVSISSLTPLERERYRRTHATASGRFDLYLLFFEQALKCLKPQGRLVFITPEKYLYVESAAPLRGLLASRTVEELHFLNEETFAGRVTYPLVTTVGAGSSKSSVLVIERDGSSKIVGPLLASRSWLPIIRQAKAHSAAFTLRDMAIRVSCGVATGADSVFVVRDSDLTAGLRPFAYPTVAGRDITCTLLPRLERSLLIPYDAAGRLLHEYSLGELGSYISAPVRRAKLLRRTCVTAKPWYAFHETPPLSDILRPKILCKDIGAKPIFVVDADGIVVPRHSVYYIVPARPESTAELADYLNSARAVRWFHDHCQRAANGFLRLQSHVLKQLPIPDSLQRDVAQLDLERTETNLLSA